MSDVTTAEVLGDQPGEDVGSHQDSEPLAPDVAALLAHVRITPTKGWAHLGLKEVWAYRELLFFLTWRDVKVRYKQTILGALWAVLVPMFTMVVFNVLFGLLMGRGNQPTVDGVPYAISTYCALVPWQLFASAMTQSSNSLVSNRNLITKVYFPRLIAPLAPVFASLVDFAISFSVLLVMVAGFDLFTDYDFHFSWALLTLPLFVLLAIAASCAVSLWFSAMNAIYRDVQYVVPFLTQLLMYVTPVIYTTDSIMKEGVPQWVRVLYGLNPMACVVEGFRWALLGRSAAPGLVLIPSAIACGLLLLGGMYYFRRMERTFADLA